ncbi:amidohydrolase family protein [Mariniflexile sp. HMF6888]|uniref:amidohydrolase family protein n=1 Tax=Mariniflexile sp. HMF6888 TaxID=3373086 RepID=UPI00378BBC83
MKKYFLVLIITIQALVSCGQTKEQSITYKENIVKDLVIKNVSVVTMKSNEVLKNQDVVIKDGKIVSILDSEKTVHQNIVEIDGTDKYIMPSLTDAHVHFPETETEMEHVMQLYLINGVTKLRSMRGDWKHVDWRNKYNAESSIYPKLYLSAPPISRNYDLTPTQIEGLVKNAKEKGFDFIKILSVKNQDIFTQLDAACKKYNLPIGGHFPSNIPDSLIFKSMYTSFEHLGGLAGVSPEVLENRLQKIKANDIFICPTLSWYSIGSGRYSYEELRNQPGMEFVPKETIEDWIEKTKQYREKLGDQAYRDEVANELKSLEEKYQIIKKAHDLGISMLLSPDSSSKYMISGFSVLGEMELLKNAQLGNYDILKMATTNFAAFFKEDYGTIEVGKSADFILLNQNPLEDLNTFNKIEGLYYNNHFLDAKKLEAMRLKLSATSQN